MANWGSTKPYSEKDIMTMQQDAVRRVKEMQTRAMQFEQKNNVQPPAVAKPHFTSSGSEGANPNQSKPPINSQQSGVEHKSPLAQMFKQSNLLGGLNLNNILGEGKGLSSILGNLLGGADENTKLGSVLKALDLDTEKLIIIGLMIILYNEGADALLLIALAYLLI